MASFAFSGPPFAKVISVIVVEHNRGTGVEGDPVRRVFSYHDPETGAKLAEHDTWASLPEDAGGPKEPRDPGHVRPY